MEDAEAVSKPEADPAGEKSAGTAVEASEEDPARSENSAATAVDAGYCPGDKGPWLPLGESNMASIGLRRNVCCRLEPASAPAEEESPDTGADQQDGLIVAEVPASAREMVTHAYTRRARITPSRSPTD